MDFNYTLKYRTFDQLLEDVSIDLNTFSLENMIEPQTLIKTVRKINYELGLRINQTKEVILEVTHGKVKLPDDFYVFNYAMLCNQYTESVGYDGMAGGTNIQEVPYVETPASINPCAPATVNCSVCNFNPCNHTAACPNNTCPTECPTPTIPSSYDPLNPYGDTCIRPRVFMNCKGEKSELIQIINTGQTRTYSTLSPLRMRSSQEIDCDCPNLYVHSNNEGSIKGGFLFTTLDTCKVYLNYQGEMEDEIGRLLVPDHALLNEYYEYALKKRIIENLALNGEDVAQRLQIIVPNYKEARNNALSVVNTPNFKEIEKIWSVNRKVQYFKYYDMFKS
jgi:hypothetical protein